MSNNKLIANYDFNSYFDDSLFRLLHIGDIVIDTGEIVVCDPLCSLGMGYNKVPPLQKHVPNGKYPVTISTYESEYDCARYLASKVTFSSETPVRYELAMKVGDSLVELEEDMIFGFPVDAGLACICDKHTEELYEAFIEHWYIENPDKNHYDDYFSEIFRENYEKYPLLQREGGDWINWNVPNSQSNIAMFNSGFGDGFYSCYWGFDEQNEICCLIVHFIDPSELKEADE